MDIFSRGNFVGANPRFLPCLDRRVRGWEDVTVKSVARSASGRARAQTMAQKAQHGEVENIQGNISGVMFLKLRPL